MKKISRNFKIIISILSKATIAILVGLASSLGKNPILMKKKDNKTIEANK